MEIYDRLPVCCEVEDGRIVCAWGLLRLMADKYETASVLQCARNVGHNEEISRRYGPGSIARIIARLMAILP